MLRKGATVLVFVAIAIAVVCAHGVRPALAASRVHVVVPGDTLWRIAAKYGVTVESLVQVNYLTSSLIIPGQTIVIPTTALQPTGIHQWYQTGWNFGPAEIDLLARLIRAEAEGEPYVGQVAVGAVVLNRLRSPLFPKRLEDVIYEPDQFEPVANGTISLPPTPESIRAALDAIAGWDPTGGALYFYNPTKAHSDFLASRKQLVAIGGHVFLV
ncbi:MAG: cell wall hydrolase [Bacillota bacterium]